MFRIVTPDDFKTTAWKNGGGVTHEILRDEGEPWRWRISIAEVSTDGPFSAFEGQTRILTVIEGGGLDLHAPGGGVLRARPFRPLTFSGDAPVDSHMVNGPVRNLNLIYDPRYVKASVEVIDGPATIESGSGQTGVLCMDGRVTLAEDALPCGAFGLGQGGCIDVGQMGRCVVVRLA
ncbi:HutD/Ves family protein [Mameliella alba]|uniref:HutD/Ves family protein n=1 Tax=Mameliella alba TaxID=561184 RepID=UPI000B5346FF|nr:HutD family protein [Mameliella alba]OWV46311.1 hypothetical protein CDZ96_18935 [Mameliella alba]GGF75419.1 hypothetical protein GCM10011319_39730 [Mameliella alba]